MAASRRSTGLAQGAVAGCFVALLTAAPGHAEAREQAAPLALAEASQGRGHRAADEPQPFVVCAGWHAYCPAMDCRLDGRAADCDCYRVDEAHIVETASIQDAVVGRLTEARCTAGHPCAVDEAPVCAAIRDGRYRVDGVRYRWVSTYSYRGWCSLLQRRPVPCDPSAPGYTGDSAWAVCDAAPCVEIPDPPAPERPLRCRCVVASGPFVGTNGTCTGDNGGIMSSFSMAGWDFQQNTYRFPMPGYEFVRGACATLTSDPWEAPHHEPDAR